MIAVPAFARFDQEVTIVGRMLAGYGELEFDLCLCVSVALEDMDTVFKTMFRLRGEKDRIEVADALGRSAFRKVNLETQFAEAISAAHYCRKIRNQFAHCHWHDDNSGNLGFADLSDLASKNQVVDLGRLKIQHVNASLLCKQEEFFKFTRDSFSFLNFESRLRNGSVPTNPFNAPRKLSRPALAAS